MKDVNMLPVNMGSITQQLSQRIAQLEQDNAVLHAQVTALLALIPDSQWQALTGPAATKPDAR